MQQEIIREDKEVAPGAEELEDGAFAPLAYWDQLQKSDVFAVVVVLLKVAEYCFLREDIACGGVYVFRAGT